MTLDKAIKEDKKFLKKFIIHYEQELNNKDFAEVYKHLDPHQSIWVEGDTEYGDEYDCRAFTALLLKNNINPLKYMDEVPEYFAFGLDIEDFVIPNNVTCIRGNAFYRCDNLNSVTIPSSVTSIGDYAFSECSSLAEITIPSGVTSIGGYAFYKCINLNSVTIPKNIKNIYSCAFKDCESLTDVYYEGSEEDWKNIKIGDYGGYRNDELLNATIHYNS